MSGKAFTESKCIGERDKFTAANAGTISVVDWRARATLVTPTTHVGIDALHFDKMMCTK